MATRQVQTRALLKQEQIQFIRAQTLQISVADIRPNTRVYVFFSDVEVTDRCYVDGSAQGTPIFTDAIGSASFNFDLPGGTFNVGEQEVIVSEVKDLQLLETTGSTFGAVTGSFNASGIKEIWQTTNTTITTTERIIQRATQDPIAQQFFTYGITGGMFLSSIELFFQTKDEIAPVTVEIRTMTNGYPTQNGNVAEDMKCTMAAADVNTQLNASVSTKFGFNPPIFLQEDSDFCFVVRSNSNKYNIFTSRMGERSFEDSRTIFEQPYVGSMFKSENSITWTAEQFEDVKFTLNRAVFDPLQNSELVLKAQIPFQTTSISNFQTQSGSNQIRYTHAHDHGSRVGDLISITIESGHTLNGIPSSEFLGDQTITAIPSSYQFEFETTSVASQTGPINQGGKISGMGVSKSGAGYAVGDTITISGGGGVGAAAYMVLNGGRIQNIVITNAGQGYTGEPTVSINTATGQGGVIYAQVVPGCGILINKPMSSFIAVVDDKSYGSGKIEASVRTISEQYSISDSFDVRPDVLYQLKTPQLIASHKNEEAFLQSNNQFEMTLKFQTDKDNVQPTINANRQIHLATYKNNINNQDGEDINSTNESGFVNSLIVTAPGAAYTATPTVFISPPDLVNGVQAVATATITAGALTGISITQAGSGYLQNPQVIIIPVSGDNTGAGAAVQSQISTFNTELQPNNGRAEARYLTKQNRLEMPQNGLRLFAVISSVPQTQVDWYVRTQISTSLSDHDKLSWKLLPCPIERKKSKFIGEVFQYEFSIDNLPEFDMYDLKCVMRSPNSAQVPYVQSYRVIAIA